MPCLPRTGSDYCYCRTFDLEVLGPVGPTILTILGTRVGGLPAGTPGQVLTTDGAGALLWAAPGAPSSHVLATNVGLGASHTMSGATAGHVLRASAANAAAFAAIQAADLPLHNIVTAHNASGLTNGHVMFASGANTFGFRAMVAADLPDHDLILDHPATGLTNGYVLTATSANTFAWQPNAVLPISDGVWTKWDAVNGRINFNLATAVLIESHTPTGDVADYATIQDAMNAAASGDTVAVPPGIYVGGIQMKAGVRLVEAIAGTVTIIGYVFVPTGATGCYVQLDKVIGDASIPTAALILYEAADVKIRRVESTYAPAFPPVATIVNVPVGSGYSGTSNLYIDEIAYTGAGGANKIAGVSMNVAGTLRFVGTTITIPNAGAGQGEGVYAGPGTVVLEHCKIAAKTTDLSQASTGVISLRDVEFTISKVSGLITFQGDGDLISRDKAIKLHRMYR